MKRNPAIPNQSSHAGCRLIANRRKQVGVRKLNLVVVGIGWAGRRHVEAVRELNRKIEIIGLMDVDQLHLHQQADELKFTRLYIDFDTLLADPDVEAVSLCTPHAQHAQQAIAAIEAGKHVLVEKPMALSVDDATRMIDAANHNHVVLYVAENLPYEPVSHFLRQVVESDDPIGELTSATATAGFQAQHYGYEGRRSWLASPEAGGTWTLHGIHTVAQLRHIFCRRYGEVEIVWMREHKASSFQRTDLEGTMTGLFTLRSGLSIHITQSAETRLDSTLGGYVLYGDQASLRAGRNGYQIFTNGQESPILPYPTPALSSYAQEFEAFADTVAGNGEGPTTGESERRSLALIQAGYESVQSGQPIHLRERFGDL